MRGGKARLPFISVRIILLYEAILHSCRISPYSSDFRTWRMSKFAVYLGTDQAAVHGGKAKMPVISVQTRLLYVEEKPDCRISRYSLVFRTWRYCKTVDNLRTDLLSVRGGMTKQVIVSVRVSYTCFVWYSCDILFKNALIFKNFLKLFKTALALKVL